MVTGATGTQNILPNLKISDMAWKIVSKKRKKKSKRTNKKNV
jgi:hypothetical protein